MNADDTYHSESEFYYPKELGYHVENVASRKRKHGRPSEIEIATDKRLFFLLILDKKINTLFTV